MGKSVIFINNKFFLKINSTCIGGISSHFLMPGSQLCVLKDDSSYGVHLITHFSDYGKGSSNDTGPFGTDS